MTYEDALTLVRTQLYPLPTEVDESMKRVAILDDVSIEMAINMVWVRRTELMAVYIVKNPEADLTSEFLTRYS